MEIEESFISREPIPHLIFLDLDSPNLLDHVDSLPENLQSILLLTLASVASGSNHIPSISIYCIRYEHFGNKNRYTQKKKL